MSANLLGQETSPYLLQHQDNPVHWLPWGEAAFARARAEDKPVLLSVGYAACHWCHVMAHESFEDKATAALMNAHFISVKVDREERPDIDRIYMDALHALGEHGGWPLTMFLTPEAVPFWGGTYFPKEARYGRASFSHVLTEIARIWRQERDKVRANGAALLHALEAPVQQRPGDLSEGAVAEAANAFLRAVDVEHGGLRGAPKFPQGPVFNFLWAAARRSHHEPPERAVTVTLTHLSQGGIYDHLGGGLARYSVDARWLAPHFEKMLYDNAQFVSLLTRVWSATGSPLFRQRIAETIGFVLAAMRTEGGFASSYDADSEGEEGKYYVWSKAEIRRILGADADLFCKVYDVTLAGNWEGHAILNRLAHLDLLSEDQEARLAASRAKLLAARTERPPPGFDDKVLADWNGLMIAALAEAALVFDTETWKRAAVAVFDQTLASLWDGERLFQAWRAGQRRNNATADGYANLISAALALYTLTADDAYVARAGRLAEALLAHHWDDAHGGLFFASAETRELIVRPRFAHDDATPNANGVMLENFSRLHLLTGNADYRRRAQAIHDAFAGQALSNPFGYASLLKSFLVFLDPAQAVLTGNRHEAAYHDLERAVIDALGADPIILHVASPARLPIEHPAYGKQAQDTRPRAYLCRGQVCAAPALTPAELGAALRLLGLPDT